MRDGARNDIVLFIQGIDDEKYKNCATNIDRSLSGDTLMDQTDEDLQSQVDDVEDYHDYMDRHFLGNQLRALRDVILSQEKEIRDKIF